MKTGIHIILFSCLIFLLSCKNEQKKERYSEVIKEKSENINEDRSDSPSLNKTDLIWLSEFQRFRQALYLDNLNEINSFFIFPLSEKQADGLLSVIYFNTGKDLRKQTKLQTKNDFVKYYKHIFRTEFKKGLLPIKSDSLLRYKFAASDEWKIINDETLYSTSVSYDESDKLLSISLDVEYVIQTDGNMDAKTESSVIFIFKINKENKLKYDRIIMAG